MTKTCKTSKQTLCHPTLLQAPTALQLNWWCHQSARLRQQTAKRVPGTTISWRCRVTERQYLPAMLDALVACERSHPSCAYIGLMAKNDFSISESSRVITRVKSMPDLAFLGMSTVVVHLAECVYARACELSSLSFSHHLFHGL